MSQAKVHNGTILITDASRTSALAFIRSLGSKGWRVIAADSHSRSPGFRSRYTAKSIVYPDPTHAPQDLIKTLLDVARAEDVDLIIPVTDQVIHPLSLARQQFDGICQLALAEQAALETVTSKDKTLELATELGIPVPKTQTVRTTSEALALVEGWSWPVVLKPEISHIYDEEKSQIHGFKVSYANNADDLAARMRQLEGRTAVLLQEYCTGIGHGIEMLANHGQPVAVFQHQRLAEIPITGGASAWRKSVALDEQLYDYSKRLVKALDWTGLIMVEFKVGSEIRLMEINGRIWGSIPVAVASGMDFPAKLVELHFGDPSAIEDKPDTRYEIGMHAYNEDMTLNWIIQTLIGRSAHPYIPTPERRQALAPLAALLTTRYRFDIFSISDPVPGWIALPQIIRKFWRKYRQGPQGQ